MLNSISADLGRVIKKKNVIIWLVIEILLIIGTAAVVLVLNKSGFDLHFTAVMGLGFSVAPVIVGIPVFLAVFRDSLQSKAMQNMIGMGSSRNQVVIGRFIEIAIIFIISFVIIAVCTYLTGIPFGVKMAQYIDTCKDGAQTLLSLLCYSSISMIVVFGTMNTSFAQTVFLLLNLGIVSAVVNTLSLIPFFAEHNINLSYVTISGLIGLAKDKSFAAAPLMWVVIVGAYMILPLIISIFLFKKKELDL